jgi:hypothetical protein
MATQRRPRGDSTEALEIDFLVASLANAKLQVAELTSDNEQLRHNIKKLKTTTAAAVASRTPSPLQQDQPDRNYSTSPSHYSMADLENKLVEERMRAAEQAFLREQSQHKLHSEQRMLKEQLVTMQQRERKHRQDATTNNRNNSSPSSDPPAPSAPSAPSTPSTPPAPSAPPSPCYRTQAATFKRALKAPVYQGNTTTSSIQSFVLNDKTCRIHMLCYLSIPDIGLRYAFLCKQCQQHVQPPTPLTWRGRTSLWTCYVEECTTTSSSSFLSAKHRACLWFFATTGYSHPTSAMLYDYKQLLVELDVESSGGGGGGDGDGDGGNGVNGGHGSNNTSQDRITINNDVGRTFATNTFSSFSTTTTTPPPKYTLPSTRSLKNVLYAYLAHDPSSVGYCQGMNFLVGLLLIGYTNAYTTAATTTTIECAALYTFLGIMHPRSRYQGNLLYRQGLQHIKAMMGVHARLVEKHLPVLSQHFQQEQVVPDLYSVSWFMTLFSNYTTLGYTEALQTTTLFFMSGWKATHRTALAILDSLQENLLAQSFGNICMALRKNFGRQVHCLYIGRQYKITRKILKKMLRQVQKQQREVIDNKSIAPKASSSPIDSPSTSLSSFPPSPSITPPKTPPLKSKASPGSRLSALSGRLGSLPLM